MIGSFKDDLFPFYAHVEAEGYEWANGLVDSEPRLVRRGGLGSKRKLRDIPSDLFITFGNLESTPEAVCEFASQYGDLLDSYGLEDKVDVHKGFGRSGATLKKWAVEIQDMHAVVELWDAIKNKRKKHLQTIIKRKPAGILYELKTAKWYHGGWIKHPAFPSTLTESLKAGDVLRPAKYALQAELNKRITHADIQTAPRLLWTHEFSGQKSEREGALVLVFKPHNLLAAMWLQFARAVTGPYDIVVCDGCGGHILMGPGAKKRGSETHDATCRKRKQRKKKSLRK